VFQGSTAELFYASVYFIGGYRDKHIAFLGFSGFEIIGISS
jgi:hypothetical protein